MYGYIKVAMAVPKVSLADVKGNLQDIKEKTPSYFRSFFNSLFNFSPSGF